MRVFVQFLPNAFVHKSKVAATGATVFHSSAFLFDPEVRCKERKVQEGERLGCGGYLGWHEQLLTEKWDPLVAIATLVLPTLACISVYSLFVQSQSRRTKTSSVEWENAAIE